MKNSLFIGTFTTIYIYGTFRIYKELFNKDYNISKEHKYIAIKYFGK